MAKSNDKLNPLRDDNQGLQWRGREGKIRVSTGVKKACDMTGEVYTGDDNTYLYQGNISSPKKTIEQNVSPLYTY